MIVLVPFDLTTIDSKKNLEVLVKRIINLSLINLKNPGKLREYTAILLAKLLSRPDVIKGGETDLAISNIVTTFTETKEDSSLMFECLGVLNSLV
jgi:hypothetical protein